MPIESEDGRAHEAAAQERRNERDRWSDNAIDREPLIGRRGVRRLLWILAAVVLIVLLATLPPLLNVNRYQRRVASAIAGAIGRPVRFDRIELHLLPLPGFTIHNFVVMEDGAFGAEPAMRANTVEARIRFGSLWRRRVEISRIQLQAPTVNLVRNAAGYWNLQGVVKQAAEVQSAPTAQVRASDTPRFPYVEATEARVNLKLGDTKLPYSLTDATFALWLPNEQAWHLRLAGRPMRTDTDASDVGVLRVEATLGRNGGSTAQQAFTLDANWKPTPLGEASKLAVGTDAGWRGSVSGEMQVQGTPSAMHISTDIHVRDLRRAEFVPAETIELDAHCEAQAMGIVHQLTDVRCALPTATHGSLLDQLPFFNATSTATTVAPDVLTLEADMPSATNWRTATAKVNLAVASPAWALSWMRLFSTRMGTSANVGGTFSLSAQYDPGITATGWTGSATCHCLLPAPAGSGTPAAQQQWLVLISNAAPLDPAKALAFSLTLDASREAAAKASASNIDESGATRPATPAANPADSLSATIDRAGTTIQYTDADDARELAQVIPALADDLPATLTGPAASTRPWNAPQTWAAARVLPTPLVRHHVRSRHSRR